MCGCETWFFILRQKHRLRVLEKRKLFQSKRGNLQDNRGEGIMRSFAIYAPYQILLSLSNQRGGDGWGF
jgi:hypothetical protein